MSEKLPISFGSQIGSQKKIVQQKVVIVGCGFLGEATALLFASRGWEVIGIARHPGVVEKNDFAGNISFFSCDVTDPTSVEKLTAKISNPSLMIYAVSSGKGGADAYATIYCEGLQRTIEAWHPQKTLFVSSSSVYGQSEGEIVNESSPTLPERLTSQLLLKAESIALNTGGIVARFAGIYGPGRSILLQKFLEGRAILEEGGHRWINQIHRDDGAEALWVLGTSPNVSGIRPLAELAAEDEGQGASAHRPAVYRGIPQDASTEATPPFPSAVELCNRSIYIVSDDTPMTQRALYEMMAVHYKKPLPLEGPRDLNRKRGWTSKRLSNARLKSLGWQPAFPSYRDFLTATFQKNLQ